ncbi:hypothetical protein CJF31_00002225 [Rutstroemia sp. NJR-2017a BVV2]|nr:hypothetical protein CJF31_00010164 [Rutstroemia sp. NJR-2017a BVV2]PQE24027.1 hypothetical protein CJF31_00002225 [Rutstroemia sp. NJR-2017a BVV2]
MYVGPVEAIARHRYPYRIGEDIGKYSTVPGIARARVACYYEAPEPRRGRDGHRGREDVVVPVAGQEYEFRDDYRYQPVGIVAGVYSRAISAGGDFVCQVGSPLVLFCQPDGHRHVGGRGQQDVWDVFGPVYRRVPAQDAASRGVDGTGGVDGIFDSHVATPYRARVYEDHIDPGRRGTCPNIVYTVVEYEEEEEDICRRGEITAVYRLVEQKLEEYAVPAKIIIYSSSIVTMQEVSRALGCYVYYRDMGEAAVKDEIRKA